MSPVSTDDPTHPGPGRRYGGRTATERRQARRARLLASGLELFGTSGYAGTTITALCAHANVSTRNFYEEFGSLEAILVTLLDESRRMVTNAVAATLEESGTDVPADERIARGVRSYLESLTADPRRARILLVETTAVSRTVDVHRGRMLQTFVGLVEGEADRAGAAGLIPDRDHHLTAVSVVGMLSMLVTLWASDRGLDASLDEIGAEATRLIQLAFGT